MKKLLAALLLCGMASATTTVSGGIKDFGTAAVGSANNSFVRFYLRGCGKNQPRINSASSAIAPKAGVGGAFYFDVAANSSGVVSATIYSTRDAAGTGNGEIECGGSYTAVWYGMVVYANGVPGPEMPVHAKSGVPLNIGTVSYITTPAVVTAPTGDTTYCRIDGTNCGFTGAISITGGSQSLLIYNSISQGIAIQSSGTGAIYGTNSRLLGYGIYGESTGSAGHGIEGTCTTGACYGVIGDITVAAGVAVGAQNRNASGKLFSGLNSSSVEVFSVANDGAINSSGLLTATSGASLGTAVTPVSVLNIDKPTTSGNYIRFSENNTLRGLIGVSVGGGDLYTGDADNDFVVRGQSNIVFAVSSTEKARYSASGLTIGGGTAIGKYITGTVTVDLASIPAQTCTDTAGITVTGATDGDPAIGSALSAIASTAGLQISAYVSSADTAKVRVCNETSGAIDPASTTYKVAVIH
jgi:hypothetical protein